MTVLELVERERVRLRRMHLVVGLALAVGATGLLLALGAAALGSARWMALPRPVPFLVWALVLGSNVVVALWTIRRIDRRATRESVAAAIEREQSMRAGSVRGVMEVADSGALGRRAAATIGARLAPAASRLVPSEQRSMRRGAMQATGAATAAVAMLAFAVPNDGLLAIFRPVRAWQGTLLPPIHFANLPPAVLRGEALRVQITALRRGTLMLSQRSPGEGWITREVLVDRRNGVATVDVGPLSGDLTLVATDGRSASDTALVRVTDRPFVGAVSMRATYPAYLGRSSESLPVGEPARVPQGTVVELSGRASTSLKNVRLGSMSDTVSLQVNDHAFEGRFEAKRSGRFAWIANGTGGAIADVPLPIELEVVPDSAPHVELVAPVTDTIVAGDDKITLRASATDDHGLTKVDLVSVQQGSTGGTKPPVVQHIADVSAAVWDGSVVLDLAPRGLKPGDALRLKFVATDNAPWGGGQRGESRELLLKIPTMEERRAIARSSMDSAVSQVKATAQAQKTLEQRTADATRDRTQRPNQEAPTGAAGTQDAKGSMTYDAAEKAKAVAKDQRALADQVKKLQETASELEQKMKQAGALDSSLSRQLQEAQALLRDAITPELLAQMKKLDDATQSLSKEQAQQSLKDMQAMQDRLREQLEKSAEMLKRAALEGSMQTLKDEAKDIADKDRALADSAKTTGSDSGKADAKQLADRTQRFDDELKKLEDRLKNDKADAGASGTDEAQKHAAASEESMRQAAGQKSGEKNQQGDKSQGDKSQQADKSQTDKSQARDSAAKQSQTAQQQPGQTNPQTSQPQRGQQNGQQQNGQQQNGQKQSGQQQNGQQQNGQQQNGQQQNGQQQNGQQQNGQNGMEQNARDAAAQMERASDAMKEARESQVKEWKSELTNALDQAIQETLQMARQEQQLEQKAKSGQSKPEEMRGEQSAVKQGLDNVAQKLQQEGQKTSLLSGRSQRSMAEAQQKVSEATDQTKESKNGQQAASSLGDAADALNRAAASLARDREKANTSSSATGFAEMLQQMQEMAKKQGSINAQAQGLLPGMGQPMSSQMQATARALAREQQQVAQQLDELGEAAGGDRAAQLAKEAKQLAEALEGGRIDAATVARQQQLFRRLLDAGRTLEKDEREDSNKREAKSAKAGNELKPDNANANGRAAAKFREPTWDELRGLSADERRAILEYFKRINAPNP